MCFTSRDVIPSRETGIRWCLLIEFSSHVTPVKNFIVAKYTNWVLPFFLANLSWLDYRLFRRKNQVSESALHHCHLSRELDLNGTWIDSAYS